MTIFIVVKVNTKLGDILTVNETTDSGKVIAWMILIMMFIDVRAFGLIPIKSLQFFRGITYGDMIFISLVIYSFFRYAEIQEYIHKNITLRLLLTLESYVFILLLVSSVEYQYNFVEYFFRIITCFKPLIIFPLILLYTRKSLGYFIKIFVSTCFIFCIVYALAAFRIIEAFNDVTTLETDFGGINILRIYADSFMSEFIMSFFIFLFLIKMGRQHYFLYIVVFALPTIMAFGRNAWFSVFLYIVLVTLIVYIKSGTVTKLFKIVVVILVSVAFFVVLMNILIPQSTDYFTAINERLFEGYENVQYDEGTYGYRINYEIPALLSVWEKNPFFGVGVHPDWAFGTKFWSSAYSDVLWPGFLAGFGIVGLSILIALLIRSMYITLNLLKQLMLDSGIYFFMIMNLVYLVIPLTNSYNLIPFSVTMTYSFVSAIPLLIPVLIEGINNKLNRDEK